MIINDHPRSPAMCRWKVCISARTISRSRRRAKSWSRDCWIGKSTHSLAQAMPAEAEGADYIGFGPLFATPTKPDYQPIGIAGHSARSSQQCSFRSFALAESSCTISRTLWQLAQKRVVIVSGLLQSADVAATTRAAKAAALS